MSVRWGESHTANDPALSESLTACLTVITSCISCFFRQLVSPGDRCGKTGDLEGPVSGSRALLQLSEGLTWVQSDRWGPPGVWPPVPECCEEERDEQGEVVAPAPAVVITLECSGVCRPMADRMLFPFIPIACKRDKDKIKSVRRQESNLKVKLIEWKYGNSGGIGGGITCAKSWLI